MLSLVTLENLKWVQNLVTFFGKPLTAVKVPLAVLGAEIDRMSPPELVKQFEETLKAKPEVCQPLKLVAEAVLLTI